ncbi:MAG: hypothetical protein ACRD4S_05560 [Candidatus Acidiferrales bacterium]
MRRATILACVVAAGLVFCAATRAEHTHTWRQSDYSEFDRGTPKGVALRSDGKLMPAPAFMQFSDPNLAYVWALRVDSRGRVYAAGGSDATVLRFDNPAKPTTVFQSSELAAQTIAFDGHDNLYVGTSPDGKVYKVTPDGQKSVFFEPKTKYIWALAVDSKGVLFVATGDTGKVFAVTPDGEGKLFYQSDERHARSLAFDSKGNLLIGTDPDGLIVRVEIVRKNTQAAPEAGAPFVIYETNKKEVTSLLADASGNLYAASIGEKQRPAAVPLVMPMAPQALPQTAPPGAIASAQGHVIIQSQQTSSTFVFPYFPSTAGGAEVVKISPDGSPDILWNSREDLVFSMGLSPSGKLLLGTGNKGEVIELEGNDVFSTVARTASSQVMSLVSTAGGKVYVATANPGKIFTLGPSYAAGGSFESEAFDAKIFSHWGRLTWWGENGATQGKVEMYARSGNTSNPDKNWSAWTGPYKTASGETVSCQPARFIQWKAVFLDTDHGGAPNISWVSVAYQPKNVAPQIEDIEVQNPGIRIQSFAVPAGSGNMTPAPIRMPQAERGDANFHQASRAEPAKHAPRMDVPPQGFEDKGYQSVVWSARDGNDDDLLYSIYYRGEGERNWRLLKDKLTEKYYSWDTVTMPDGAYYLKIVASDSPSNPPDQTLTGERESDRFEIANTPPQIENLRAESSSSPVTIVFDGSSSSGAITHAQYSVDAGDWRVVFPVGLLSDAPKESYQIQLSSLAPGEHTVAVQIADEFENTAAAKVTFMVAGRAAK